MAPRRTHKKSRTGCDTCRQRRVKCDEQGPPCTRCATRRIVCEFSRRSVSRQSSGNPTASPIANPSADFLAQAGDSNLTSSTQSLEQNLIDGYMSPSSRRILELELLHHYSTRTYQGFTLLSSEEGLWQVVVVEEALKFDFLMKQLFALTALHKATETQQSALKYANYALESQNEALTLFRSSLQTINQENSSALFIFSIMTTIFAIVPLESVPGINLHSPLENLLVLFEFLKGSASVLRMFSSLKHIILFAQMLASSYRD
ncbi:hypothetical protein DL98DRAFT_438034 [Cadophora sp. DSE1049]|nr:hypothetical protein DL98DRAFT_438034 [Cadophora sp. DSE1049]